MNKRFNSKVLLFGEYSIIKKSNALSIPYPLFDGELTFSRDKKTGVDGELKAFGNSLRALIAKGEFSEDFDIDSFMFDLSQGLIFDSMIPQGFGVGSSGALCAAVYDRYELNKAHEFDLSSLKTIFSKMEGHFHGSSSGIDPLISYLNKSILVHGEQGFDLVSLPSFSDKKGAIFLLNTGRARRTEPLVNLFLEKCKSKQFNRTCEGELIPLTNQCIDHFLKADIPLLLNSFKELSKVQREIFQPMIPNLFLSTWDEGLEEGKFFLKLCGAGGGGFILGISEDFSLTSKILSAHELRPIIRF